jgi:hypothetical protein
VGVILLEESGAGLEEMVNPLNKAIPVRFHWDGQMDEIIPTVQEAKVEKGSDEAFL